MTEDKLKNIKSRIRKLFALARDSGATPAESELAITRANEMLLAYGIENFEENDALNIVIGSCRSKPIKRWNKHEVILANAVAYLFNARAAFTKDAAVKGEWLCFCGTEANVFASETLYDYLLDSCNVRCAATFKTYRAQIGRKLTQAEYDNIRPSFQRAFVTRIANRVYEIKNANRAKCKALMVINAERQAAQDFLMAKPGTKRTAIKLREIYGIGTGAGDVAGQLVKLQEEVSRNG